VSSRTLEAKDMSSRTPSLVMLYNIDECRQGQLEQPYRMIVVTGDTVFAFTADRTTTATAKKQFLLTCPVLI